MAQGLSTRFNILQRSPYDVAPEASCATPAAAPPAAAAARWVPSRYTVRATATDGTLILWNTFSGKISVFKPALAPSVEAILKQKDGVEGGHGGTVRFLAERGFLIKEGTDEYRRFQFAFGRQHHAADRLQLILLASEDCNFRCKYCYEDFARGTMQPAVREGIKKYVARRVAAGVRQLSVDWFGGEPLYGWEAIEDLAPFFRELADAHSLTYISKMATNAYLLTPDLCDRLLAWGVRGFQVTIDGPAETHDCSRPTRDGQPTFATIFANLQAMRQRRDNFGVNLRVNYDRDNSGQLVKFLELAAQEFKGDDRFRLCFRAVGLWGGPGDSQLNICSPDEGLEMQLRLWEEARKRGLYISDSIHHAKGLGSQVCYAARPYSFIIGATGKVMKCTIDLDRKDRNVVGSLDAEGVMVLDDDKMARWTEPIFESDGKCKKCVILPVCQGLACPVERWDAQKTPCPAVRTTFKRELREAAGDFS